MNIDFTKMQSAGNDFVLVEDSGLIEDYPAFARFACDRHFGIGADGILVLTGDEGADVGMRMFNPDGSEAEACGNGLRCLAKYSFDNGFATGKTMTIATIAGVREARIIENSAENTIIETSMGKPSFHAGEIPVLTGEAQPVQVFDITVFLDYPLTVDSFELNLALASMGNPHAVYFTRGSVKDFPLTSVGPQVENSAIFPQKTNFEVVRVIDRNHVEARVWERGAGETLACGSGAAAIGVLSQLAGFTDNPVTVSLPGGNLEVTWSNPGEVYVKGKPVTVFSGQLLNVNFDIRG
jgi:diaminopimelate epimerase